MPLYKCKYQRFKKKVFTKAYYRRIGQRSGARFGRPTLKQFIREHQCQDGNVPPGERPEVVPPQEDIVMIDPNSEVLSDQVLPVENHGEAIESVNVVTGDEFLPLENSENRPSRSRGRKILQVQTKSKCGNPIRMLDLSDYLSKSGMSTKLCDMGGVNQGNTDMDQPSGSSVKSSGSNRMESLSPARRLVRIIPSNVSLDLAESEQSDPETISDMPNDNIPQVTKTRDREQLQNTFTKTFTTPLTEKRNPNLNSFDKTLFLAKVGKGSRLRWRRAHMRTTSPDSISQEEFILTSLSLLQKIDEKFVYKCRRCKVGKAMYKIEGRCSSRYLIVECRNCGSKVSDKPDELDSVYIRDLKLTYLSILSDMGFNVYDQFMASINIPRTGKTQFYKHANIIYDMMDLFYKQRQEDAVKAIKEFYIRKGTKVNADGSIDITASLDGSYPRRGYFSLYCLSFLYEAITGTTISFAMTERCTTCPKREIKDTHCVNHLFHGSAQVLEGHNALKLFELCKEHNLRIKILVADGDLKVLCHKYVKNFDGPNPEDEVIKEECTNHFLKKFYTLLKDALHNTPDHILKVSSKKKTSDKLTPEDYYLRYPFRKHAELYARKFSNLCGVVLNQSRHKGAEAMREALLVIPHHYSDYQAASVEERIIFHAGCDAEWCRVPRCNGDKNLIKNCVPLNKRDRPVDGEFHTSVKAIREAIFEAFDIFANIETLSRCTRGLTQNVNESNHARVYIYI